MRRKSERNKTTSTSSGSPEKKATPARRGRRRSVAANAEHDEKAEEQQTEEDTMPSGIDSEEEEDQTEKEVPMPKSARKKLTRGGASKAGSEDREEPRPSRSRRRTTNQPKYAEVVEEEDEVNGSAEVADEVKVKSPSKPKSVSPSKRKKQQPVEEVVEQKMEDESEEQIAAQSPSHKLSSPVPEIRTNSPKERSVSPKQRSPSPEQPILSPKQRSPSPPPPIAEEQIETSVTEPQPSSQQEEVTYINPESSPIHSERRSPSPVVTSRPDSPPPILVNEQQEEDPSIAPPPEESSPAIEMQSSNENSNSSPLPDKSAEVAEVEEAASPESNIDAESNDKELPAPEPEKAQPKLAEDTSNPKAQRTSSTSSSSSSSSSSESDREEASSRRSRKPIKSLVDAPTPKIVAPPAKTPEPEAVHQPTSKPQKKPTTDDIDDKQIVAEKENQAAIVVVKVPVLAKPIRKRKWLSQKSTTEVKPQILAISTDSLKNLIPDVRPVPLSDVKLDSSPEEEIDDSVNDDDDGSESAPESALKNNNRRGRRESSTEEVFPTTKVLNVVTAKPARDVVTVGPVEDKPLLGQRKVVLVVNDANINNGNAAINSNKVARPPSPAKFNSSSILYITNLVRPFTVLQLKGLLARTGRLCENGFWIDKIKSKCYVKYETEDEAVETRHALHGVRWPQSNPKCLNVDFGSEATMDKAIASTLAADPDQMRGAAGGRDERVSGGWERFETDEKRDKPANRPVREWDLGKKEELVGGFPDRGGRGAGATNASGNVGEDGVAAGRDIATDRARELERGDRRKRSAERGIRRSTSVSPGRKFQKKENEPPLRLLDDLFRKTKNTPCIYWLPLTAEQIAVKEEARRLLTIEHRRKIEENVQKDKERQKEREKEREKDRERDRERDRARNRDRSGDRRRDNNSRRSKSRDGGGGGDRDRRRH